MAVANVPGISTLKMRLGYAVETIAGTPRRIHGFSVQTQSEVST